MMTWKNQLQKLEQLKEWDFAIDLMQKVIEDGARLIDYTLSQAFGIDIGPIFLNKMDPVAPPSANTKIPNNNDHNDLSNDNPPCINQ